MCQFRVIDSRRTEPEADRTDEAGGKPLSFRHPESHLGQIYSSNRVTYIQPLFRIVLVGEIHPPDQHPDQAGSKRN